MDNTAFDPYISLVLDRIYYLAEAAQNKCQTLEKLENKTIQCKRILKLCSRIQKNCVYFGKDLIKEALKNNILLENEDSESDYGYSDSSQNENLNHVLTISVKLGDTVKTKDIFQTNGVNINEFWLDLIKFTEDILSSNKKQNQEKIVNPTKQIECGSKNVLGEDDELLRQIREIFGDDSDFDNNEETTTVPLHNNHLENIEVTNKKKFIEKKSSNDDQVEKVLEHTAIDVESISSHIAKNNKEDEHRSDGEKVEVLEVNVNEQTCRKSVLVQSKKDIDPKNLDKEEIMKDKEINGGDSFCTFQITESLEADMATMDKDFNYEDGKEPCEETSKEQHPSLTEDEILNAVNKDQSVDSTESHKASTSRNANAENSDLEPQDIESTQIVVSKNKEGQSAELEDIEPTQICIGVDEVEKDVTDERNEFMSLLGLSETNGDVQSQVEDSLLDDLVAVSHSEDNDVAPSRTDRIEEGSIKQSSYSDQVVNDALRYIQQWDMSSESCSLKSDLSDCSIYSDYEDSSHITSNLSKQNESKTSEESTLSTLEEYTENDSNRREKTPETTSPSTSNIDNTKANFIPKECVVNIVRADIANLQNKYNECAKKAQEEFLKKKYSLKDCFVKLEHPKVLRVSSDSEHEIRGLSDDDEINRLCDLSGIGRKRREEDNATYTGIRNRRKLTKIKRRRRIIMSGSDTSDLSGFSSVSDSELRQSKGGIFDEEDVDQTQVSTAIDPNELLTEIVCHTIHASDSSSTELECDEQVKRKKRSKKICDTIKVKTESKESSWRDDPLLRGSLALPSETTNNSSKIRKKRKRRSSSKSSGSDSSFQAKEMKKSKQLNPEWRSDGSSATSSSEGDYAPKAYMDFLKSTKVKGQSSNDSDVEVVNDGGSSKASVINLESDEERDKKPGRRNILSVLSSAELRRETQKAAEEEEQRVLKLQMRDQMRITKSQVVTEDCLILDTSSDSYNLTVDPVLSKRLFKHQVEGVKFMWDACYLSLDSLDTFEGTGCILAHNMGLGKTFQVITLVHTLFSHSITNTNHVLIVCPLSTVSGWIKEFKSGMRVAARKTHINIISIQSSDDSDAKFAIVNKWKQKGGVLIIGYEAFQKLVTRKTNNQNKTEFLRNALVDPGPDLVVCDEGHLLKNGKALRTKALMEIRTKRRIALTGTPLQNNLTEYYFMVEFVKPNLLGTYHEFRRQFVNPIMNGQYEDSVEADITLMKKRTHVLHRLLKNTVQRYEATELQKYLGNMKDFAIFIELHPVQKELYKGYIEMAKARKKPKAKKSTMKYFFTDYQVAKFICSHPQLLCTMETQSAQVKKKTIKELDTISQEPEVQKVEGIPDGWWKSKFSDEIKTNIEFGTKLEVMMGIIEEAEKIEEKVLIFTSSLVELSSVEYFLKLKGTPGCPSWRPRRDYFRMDGTVPPSVRTQMCDKFNNTANKKLRVFLMSHKVGGLGLNLVAASRVILLGANFNPSHDTQSIFRAYRFGQEKCVYIYRLLSMGTMEEKIYHRCVTKLAIASRVVDKHQIARHYKNLDLEDLYTVAVDFTPERSVPTRPDDDLLSNVLLKFKCIYKYLQHQKLLENRPDEDLNEEDKMKAWEEFKEMNELIVKPTGNASLTNSVMLPEASGVLELPKPETSVDPLAITPSSVINFMALASIYTANAANKNSIQILVPNPAVFRVNTTETNSLNNTSTKQDKLENVNASHTILPTSTGETKKKTSIIAPNPFALSKGNNKKENVAKTKQGITPFRKSSSDDFQKPKSNPSSRKYQTSGVWTSTARKPGNLKKVCQEQTATNDVRASAASIAVDDDDVVMVVDEPDIQTSKQTIMEALQKLNNSSLSITYGNQKSEKKKTPQLDTSIIEIL